VARGAGQRSKQRWVKAKRVIEPPSCWPTAYSVKGACFSCRKGQLSSYGRSQLFEEHPSCVLSVREGAAACILARRARTISALCALRSALCVRRFQDDSPFKPILHVLRYTDPKLRVVPSHQSLLPLVTHRVSCLWHWSQAPSVSSVGHGS
jgi:hypothetical protein